MRLSGSAAKIESEEVTTASLMVRRGSTGINTVLIHDTGWVKVPVQFLALAVVARGGGKRCCAIYISAVDASGLNDLDCRRTS